MGALFDRIEEIKRLAIERARTELQERSKNLLKEQRRDSDTLNEPLRPAKKRKISRSNSDDKLASSPRDMLAVNALFVALDDKIPGVADTSHVDNTVSRASECSPPPVPPDSAPSRSSTDTQGKVSPGASHGSIAAVEDSTRWAPIRKQGKRSKVKYLEKAIVNTHRTDANSQIDWYNKVNMRDKFSRSDVQNLSYINTLIKNCHEAHAKGQFTALHVSKLRNRLHDMEFYRFLKDDTGITIKKSRILEPEGLPQIFDKPSTMFPKDVVADAEALYRRWKLGDFDPNILRGIITTKGKLASGVKRISYKLQTLAAYPQRVSANVIGHNDLTVGQWWPLRICALRDGAHGEQEGGISGQTGKGVFAICISEGAYQDEDLGDSIKYCGTEGSDGTPTKNTSIMLATALNHPDQPVRVLRAKNKDSEWAPAEGLRYDGLYTIVGHELVKRDTAMYRFELRRQPGQDPIRCGGETCETARPTKQELNELLKIRKEIGMTVV